MEDFTGDFVKTEEYRWQCHICRKNINIGQKMVLAYPKPEKWEAKSYCEKCFDKEKRFYEKRKFDLKKACRKITIHKRQT